MIKRHDDCAVERFVTYQAASGYLPAMFDDGSVNFGPENSVQLLELSPNRHVEIYLRYIDTRVIIRHYPNVDMSFLTVGLLMPEMILNQSVTYTEGQSVHMLELCSQGCPRNQRINYLEYLSRGGATVRYIGSSTQRLFTEQKNSVDGMMVMMSRGRALRRCQQLKLVDFYLDSCVFDLMNTGDEHFAEAAFDVMMDTIRHHPEHGATLNNRTALILNKHYTGSDVTSSASSISYNIERTRFVLLWLLYLVFSCALTTTTTTTTTTTCQIIVTGLAFTLTATTLQ